MARLSIKVVPGARADRLVGRYGDALKVQVSAPAEQGRANQAAIDLLARALGVSPGRVAIVRGHGSPRKVIEIAGIEQEEAEQRLAAATGHSSP